MKLNLSIRLIVFLGILTLSTVSRGQSQSSIQFIEEIEQQSNGNISIEIPENILQNIFKKESPTKVNPNKEKPKGTGVEKTTGYRIQVFSDGRNQSTLESRAKARGNTILNKFPKYRGQIYTFSNSPNWYTRIGNFKTSQEANEAMAELKKAFPGFASEMRVVKSNIVVIK